MKYQKENTGNHILFISIQKIKDFILSFNPSHSHYKLNHSPNRKYIDDKYKYNMCSTRLYKEFAKLKGFEPQFNKNETLINNKNPSRIEM